MRSLIGNGVSLDPAILLKDFDTMHKNGIDLNSKKLVISDRASLVTSYHDEVADKLGKVADLNRIHGFDMAHAFKPIKLGLRVTDLVFTSWSSFEEEYKRIAGVTESLFGMQLDKKRQAEDLDSFKKLRDILVSEKLVDDTVLLLNREMK